MNILILSRSAMTYSPYHEWLAELDANLYLFTSPAKLDLPHEQQARANRAYRRIELFDNYGLDGRVVSKALRLHQEVGIDAVIAMSEFDLIRAGQIREHCALPGQGVDSARAFRDKVVMKDCLLKRSVSVTPYGAVTSVLDLVSFIEAHGYPVVIKPRLGAGSVAVRIISNAEELHNWAAAGLSLRIEDVPHLMVEQFVPGQLYHIDGFMHKGRILFDWPSRYTTNGLGYQCDQPTGSVQLSAANPLRRRLQDFTRQVLTALPTPAITTFHAEVFHTPDDRLLLGEIASRTGGGRVNDCLRIAFGLNMNRLWVRTQAGLPVEVPPAAQAPDPTPRSYAGFIILQTRPGIFNGAPSTAPFPWVDDYRIVVNPGSQMLRPNSVEDQIANFVVVGDNEQALAEHLAEVTNWFWSRADISPIA
jgi:biotin carboxylase